MALHSNTELLSGSAQHRRKPKGKGDKGLNIVFDEKARAEYLTGFRKRNKEKKQEKAERYKERIRKEKAEKRRDKRRRIREAISDFVKTDPSFQEYREEMEDKEIIAQIKYEDEDATTTVLIESLEQ